MVISDFDGTFGTAPDIVDGETLKAAKDYIARGGKFVICTGRMFSSIRRICQNCGLTGPVISYQGAMINDIESGKSLFTGGLDYNLAAEVTEKLIKENVQVIVDIDDILYYEQPSGYLHRYERAVHVTGVKTDSLIRTILEKKRAVQKVAAICAEDFALPLTEKYAEEYKGRLLVNNGSAFLVELINPACSKAFSVEYLSKYYGIGYDKIMAIGDSTNDIELLSGGWFGVAVGDGREELKRVADEVTVPFKDKPVKVLIEKYCK